MTREQAEKLRREKRKKRLRRKRIKAFSMMIVTLAVVVLVGFFAVKGITTLVGKNENNIPQNPTTDNQPGTENPDVSGDNPGNTADNQTGAENPDANGENPADNTNTQPSGENPEPEQPANTTPTAKPEKSWSTILVNSQSLMPDDYAVEVRTIKGSEKQFDVRAADALEKMLDDARAAGYNMYLVSAYRTLDYQKGLFSRKVNQYKALGYDDATAYSEAAKWVAVPGTSEHCLGLAADIVSSTWYNYNNDLTEDFEKTEHFEWLYNHCAEYGFILRYPKNREATTGISYEPWHYRYVGVEAAKYIMENNITLEEFCAD